MYFDFLGNFNDHFRRRRRRSLSVSAEEQPDFDQKFKKKLH